MKMTWAILLVIALAHRALSSDYPFLKHDPQLKEYPYYVTEDGGTHLGANGSKVVEQAKIEEAKHAKDSQPANKDPEGNWGAVSNGIQASIHFDKAVFGTNEPIEATIIVRNVGNEWRMYSLRQGLASCVTVINPENTQLSRKDRRSSAAGYVGDNVDPGMQRKSKIDLTPFYNFQIPGKYIVAAKVRTYAEHSNAFKWVQSSNTVITVTNSSATPNKGPR